MEGVKVVFEETQAGVAVATQQATNAACRMAVVHGEFLHATRAHARAADATATALIAVHAPVLCFGDAEHELSRLDDPAGFALRIAPPGLPILDIKLRYIFVGRTDTTLDINSSSLYTFGRDATTWLGIAHWGFHRIWVDFILKRQIYLPLAIERTICKGIITFASWNAAMTSPAKTFRNRAVTPPAPLTCPKRETVAFAILLHW